MPSYKDALKYAIDSLLHPKIAIDKFSDKQLNLDISLSYAVIHRVSLCTVGFICIYQLFQMLFIWLIGSPNNIYSSIIITFNTLISSIAIYYMIRNHVGPERLGIAEILLRIRTLPMLLSERRRRNG